MRPTEPLFSRLAFCFACIAVSASAWVSAEEVGARASSRDIKVPEELVHRLEQDYIAFLSKLEGAASAKDNVRRSLLILSAEFTQTRRASLREDVHVSTPLGGGVIDMADIVTPVRGAFNVKIRATRESGEPLTDSRVYYISRAKSRRVDGKDYGAGCGKYMDISTYFHKRWESTGFDLYSAEQRYVSVLAGTFLFVDFAKEALYVGSVTFTDSRYPGLLCE